MKFGLDRVDEFFESEDKALSLIEDIVEHSIDICIEDCEKSKRNKDLFLESFEIALEESKMILGGKPLSNFSGLGLFTYSYLALGGNFINIVRFMEPKLLIKRDYLISLFNEGKIVKEQIVEVIHHESAHLIDCLLKVKQMRTEYDVFLCLDKNDISIGHGKEFRSIMRKLGYKKAKAKMNIMIDRDNVSEEILILNYIKSKYKVFSCGCKDNIIFLDKKLDKFYICSNCEEPLSRFYLRSNENKTKIIADYKRRVENHNEKDSS